MKFFIIVLIVIGVIMAEEMLRYDDTSTLDPTALNTGFTCECVSATKATTAPTNPGIYIFGQSTYTGCVASPNTARRIFYIGKSETNIQNRIRVHLNDEFYCGTQGACFVCWRTVAGNSNQDPHFIEAMALSKWCFPFNGATQGGTEGWNNLRKASVCTRGAQEVLSHLGYSMDNLGTYSNNLADNTPFRSVIKRKLKK